MNSSVELGYGWHNALLRQAATNPAAPAMISPSETLSFKQLAWRVGKWANALLSAGVKPGQIVVVRMPREFDAVASAALSMIGAVSASNTAKQYYDFEPITDWILTRQPIENYPESKQILITPPWIQRALNNTDPLVGKGFQREDDLARLVFTSGTTGRPKSVPLTSWQIQYRTEMGLAPLPVKGPILALYDLGSAAGFFRLTGDLHRGQPYLTMGALRNPSEPIALSKRVAIEGLQGSPAQVQGFLDTFLRSTFDLSHLRYVRSGGASVPEDLQRFVRNRFGFPLEVGYGSTEAGYIAGRANSAEDDSRDVGELLPGVQIQIVDDQHNPLPVGELGMVRIKTPDVVSGYFNNPEDTAKSFRDGWFYPGDTGTLTAENRLILGGRVAELINLGGVKLDPVLLDEVAAGASDLNAATQIAAFGFHDSRGQLKLGFAHPTSVRPNERAIKKAIEKRFKIKDLMFLPLEIMPMNDSGKVKRSSLSELASKRAG